LLSIPTTAADASCTRRAHSARRDARTAVAASAAALAASAFTAASAAFAIVAARLFSPSFTHAAVVTPSSMGRIIAFPSLCSQSSTYTSLFIFSESSAIPKGSGANVDERRGSPDAGSVDVVVVAADEKRGSEFCDAEGGTAAAPDGVKNGRLIRVRSRSRLLYIYVVDGTVTTSD
jgi:hypothetical protein